MDINEQGLNQKIREDMTQIQSDLERVVRMLFERAGNKIKPEKKEEVQKEMEGTKQLLEHFKSKYA